MLTTNKPQGNKSGRTSACFGQSWSHVPEHGKMTAISASAGWHLMETAASGHGWAWNSLAPETASAVKKHTSGLRCRTWRRTRSRANPASAEDQTCEAPRGKRVPSASAQTWQFSWQWRGSQRPQMREPGIDACER